MAKKKQTAPEHPLGEYDFQCEKCKAVHHKSVYCIAQQASGNEIVFTCPCGHKMDVPE
jgi:hypothetical protein